MNGIRKSIVGIVAPEGFGYKFAGTGFLVHDNLILTCAHVADLPYEIGGRIFAQFQGQTGPIEVTRVGYSPSDKDDVAVLHVEKLPDGIEPLPLAESRNCQSHRFVAYGYLQQGEFEALFGKGEIIERVTDKREREFLQLYSEQVMHGYSGCPVWDETEQAVVGMVTKGLELKIRQPKEGRITSDKEAHFGTSFATPTETLQKVYPDLKLTKVKAPQVTTDWGLKHPYPMPPNFTGRVAERAMLTKWLNEDTENRLFIIRALGGFGKSALSWHWLTHDVDPKEWTKVVWWSFYEGDAKFEHFLEETLKYLKIEVPQGQRTQVDELLKAMQSQKTLLIMDGFERALRAYSSMNAAYQADESPLQSTSVGLPSGEGQGGYDCVNINAEIFLKSVCSLPGIKSKVLMTTRLTPRAVKPYGEFMQDCREERLEAMQKEDAVEFFHKQKIKGTHAEIEAACAPYGYHPLSLRLLAGRILKDFENPADIVVAYKLKIDGDLKQHQQHVLEVSYNSLPLHEGKLLSTIACFRSPVAFDILMAISKPVKKEKQKGLSGFFKKKTSFDYTENIDSDLKDLVERGLLHFDEKNKKFDLHPIVRRYAYDRLTAADRRGAHQRLVNYFEAVPKIEKVGTLEDLAPVIELYHHMVRAGKLDEARVLYRDRLDPLYYQFGAYQLIVELIQALFLDGEDKPPRLKEESAQAWTLNELANTYAISGQPRRGVPLFEMHNALRDKAGDKKNLAVGLGNVANMAQIYIGALRQAERNLRRSIDLCREIKDEFQEAVGHQDLGRVLLYRSAWQEAEQELDKSLQLAEKQNHVQMQGVTWSYRALRFLLMARADPQSSTVHRQSSIKSASRTLELADEHGLGYPVPRDYIRAYWLFGAAYRANSNLTKAEENLSKAIHMCRQINLVDHEADILLDLARLRYDQKNYEEARSLAEEALTITERCGYVLQGADVNLFLAQYALEQEKDKVKAREYAQTALKLAHCDDGPPYYYKVAYEEAERLLEN